MKKAIPIGHEDFRDIITGDLYYVDKTLLIKDILDKGGKVNLFTRPRRFGKTLNLSMVRRFFEDERTAGGEKIDNGSLFDGLAISGAGEAYLSMQQQYPVINLSLKSAKQPDYQLAYAMLKKRISQEFDRHRYVLEGALSEKDKTTFLDILNAKDDKSLYIEALQFLSKCLETYHGKRVIILIDEYDVPLENAYFNGFYDEMIAFIRSLFESALKTNASLEFGMITGCLRISRESIFTGFNNLLIHSLRGTGFSESFGFTQGEVEAMLKYYDLMEKKDEIQRWYDGYCIDGKEIYNPWSVLNYVKAADMNPERLPEAYWSNTSSNDIIRELVEHADLETKDEIETLIEGGTIEKPIHEDITYDDIHQSMDNLWNFLFFTGYLKCVDERQADDTVYMKLMIPNTEVKTIYRNHILSWFDGIKEKIREPLLAAILAEDTAAMENELSELLQKSISYYDYAENYYHGFLTGLLTGMNGYTVVSNRESGTGRPDIIMCESKFMGTAVIFELKVTDKFTEMEAKCNEALKQIEEKNYAQPLIDDGYQKILKYGICFFKKGCMVKTGK